MEMYTFTIEISMCIQIIGDFYRHISVGTRGGGLKVFEWCQIAGSKTLSQSQ